MWCLIVYSLFFFVIAINGLFNPFCVLYTQTVCVCTNNAGIFEILVTFKHTRTQSKQKACEHPWHRTKGGWSVSAGVPVTHTSPNYRIRVDEQHSSITRRGNVTGHKINNNNWCLCSFETVLMRTYLWAWNIFFKLIEYCVHIYII